MRLINQNVFGYLSARSRHKKMALLHEAFSLTPGKYVLDIGGQIDEVGMQLLESRPQGCHLTVLNYDWQHLPPIRMEHPGVHLVQGDARNLPFPDGYFDLVYSNAVIEHVGSYDDQMAMASEIIRVGRAWFITTPNRWFPFELHTRLPFVSWLPASAMLWIARRFAWNHVHRRYMRNAVDEHLRLMTHRELRRAFPLPASQVVKCRVTPWPETLVVIGSRESA